MEDKTQILNSQSSKTEDKTIISTPDSTKSNQINEENKLGKDSRFNEESKTVNNTSNSAKDFLKETKTKPTTSTIAVGAASAVAAGIAGTAIGTVYSEDIKEVFASELSAEELSLAEQSLTSDKALVDSELSPENPDDLVNASNENQTNSFTVTLIDTDNDGLFDEQKIEFQLVDGITIPFFESGDSLNPSFIGSIDLADNSDFPDAQYTSFESTDLADSIVYQIQPGDTLSEIAAANHTSIAHILELNPHISDPNVIMAGKDLVIPQGDNISNPYQDWNQDSIADESYFVDEVTETPTNDYDTIDWEPYYEDSVDNTYSSELSSINFDEMEIPENYDNSDMNDANLGIDDSGLAFL